MHKQPTDSELIENFREHRREIDTLVEMIRSDKVLRRVGDNWTNPSDPATVGIDQQRIADYRRRLRQIGYPMGFVFWPETEDVKFLAWGEGIVGASASKSVVNSMRRPEPLVTDLDSYKAPSGLAEILAYRHIEDNWYLEYASD